jgi:hypothetical protein
MTTASSRDTMLGWQKEKVNKQNKKEIENENFIFGVCIDNEQQTKKVWLKLSGE